MAQNVERLKIEFLKQMQSEEERMQEEVQALQKKYQIEHTEFQERSESVLRAAQQQFEKANNVRFARESHCSPLPSSPGLAARNQQRKKVA